MKNLIAIVATLILVAGCASNPPHESASENKSDVLILAPQGVDSSKDSVGFNNLVRNVTQAFSKQLQDSLQMQNLKVVNVLDQNPKYDVGQKLAIYSVKNLTKSVFIITIETETIDGDSRLLLQAQHINQDLLSKDGRVVGAHPVSVVKKSYLLRSSKRGDNPGTMSDLVDDFLHFINIENQLKK